MSNETKDDVAPPSERARLLGAKLKRLRLTKKWIQEVAEAKTGVAQSTISRWENGKGVWALDDVAEYVAKYDRDPDAFLFGSEGDHLSDDERELVRMFRLADSKGRTVTLQVLKSYAEDHPDFALP